MQRRTGPPGVVWLALIGLVAIAAGMMWMLLQEPSPLGVLRLEDGSTVRLEAVTVGSQQRFVSGPRWRRMLARRLPAGPPNRLVGTIHTYSTPNPSDMVFWTLFRPPPSTRAASLRAALFDEHGCRFPTYELWAPPEGSEQVTMRVAQAVPRRGTWIGVRLEPFGSDQTARGAEFRVANPAPGPYPVGKSPPLPITQRDGPLSMTLAALTTGAEGPGPPLRPATPGQAPWSRASFRITQAGQRADEWYHPIRLTFSDATGNRFYPQGGSRYRLGELTHVAFEGGLCAREPAWKLRVEFAQMSQFDPADLWTVRGVPVAKQGALTRSFAWTTRHGVRIKLVGIAVTAAQAPPGVGVGSLSAVFLQTSVPLKGMWLSLVRATDDQGRELAHPGLGSSDSREFSFHVKTFADTRRVDLTFALARSRFAKFIAKPSRVAAGPR